MPLPPATSKICMIVILNKWHSFPSRSPNRCSSFFTPNIIWKEKLVKKDVSSSLFEARNSKRCVKTWEFTSIGLSYTDRQTKFTTHRIKWIPNLANHKKAIQSTIWEIFKVKIAWRIFELSMKKEMFQKIVKLKRILHKAKFTLVKKTSKKK